MPFRDTRLFLETVEARFVNGKQYLYRIFNFSEKAGKKDPILFQYHRTSDSSVREFFQFFSNFFNFFEAFLSEIRYFSLGRENDISSRARSIYIEFVISPK